MFGTLPDCWNYRQSNVSGQPAFGGGVGTSVAIGANDAKGSYTDIMTLTQDAWLVDVIFNTSISATTARPTLADIAIDPAGGTSYSVLIPDLVAGAVNVVELGALHYRFPLHIPAGSQIGCRAQVGNVAGGALYCWLVVRGLPEHTTRHWKGHAVRAYGVDSSNSRGTAVTPGTTSEGTWFQLGTIAASDCPRWWQLAVSHDQATMVGANWSSDLSLGASGGDRTVLDDVRGSTTTSEVSSNIPHGDFRTGSPAEDVFGRTQVSTAPHANVGMIAYGVV